MLNRPGQARREPANADLPAALRRPAAAPFRRRAARTFAGGGRRSAGILPVGRDHRRPVRHCALLMLWALAFGNAALAAPPQPAQPVQAGQVAPAFILPSVWREHPAIALADHQGKVVYLDFWSAWCEPCRRTMPALARLREAWPQERFEVLALNQDTSRADALRFLEQVPVGYPVALDLGGATARRYGLAALPAAFIIDGRGIVRHVLQGPQVEDFARIERAVARLVGQEQGTGR